MKRRSCVKDEKGQVLMNKTNLAICLSNQQQAFSTFELNESLHLQYYGFSNIDNLSLFPKLHTLYLNNNLLTEITHLQDLNQLVTLNLSYNRIKEFKNLRQLKQLYSLDLSHNFIQSIPPEEVQGLHSLHHLKLNHNLLNSYQSISGLEGASSTITFLDISQNESLNCNNQIYNRLLSKTNLSVLVLHNTPFSRNTANYRKETINAIKTLTFLDERPITEDERMLAEAWKKGGLPWEKEVRANIREKTVQKNQKLYDEMEQRNRIIEDKRARVFAKLTHLESESLSVLHAKKSSAEYDLMSEQQKSILNLQIEDLEKYKELMILAVQNMDLEKELNEGKIELPKMLIEKETNQAIYIYNVCQEQIPLIAQKYYPYESRPIIAVNYSNPAETRWVKQYDQLLSTTYYQARGNLQLLVPLFNLGLYDLDTTLGRKVKRFELQELTFHLKTQAEEQIKQNKILETLNELD